jgi:hypothetical protein
MRVFSVGKASVDGVDAAFLYGEPDLPEAPLRYMIQPTDGDAGHLAAMAQYLARGEDAVVFVHESAMDVLLTDGFVSRARARGVIVTEDNDDNLILTSADGSVQVEIRFPSHAGELAGTSDAGQLLDMASLMFAPAR